MPSPDAGQISPGHRCLLLVRHAKSAWDDPTVGDHDRPLAPRGIAALPRMLDHLTASSRRPEIVLCSSARRTVETLAGIEPAIAAGARVEIERELYGAGAAGYRARLRELDDAVGCAVLVGHNPGIQELVVSLAGSGDDRHLSQVASKLPTGAIATLSFDGAWADLAMGAARLDDLFVPRPPRP